MENQNRQNHNRLVKRLTKKEIREEDLVNCLSHYALGSYLYLQGDQKYTFQVHVWYNYCKRLQFLKINESE